MHPVGCCGLSEAEELRASGAEHLLGILPTCPSAVNGQAEEAKCISSGNIRTNSYTLYYSFKFSILTQKLSRRVPA
jgi:hypothetical protein